MAERSAFQEKQYAFAAHIRDPDHRPAPAGVEDRRMAIYRELFFNNLLNLIGSTFPVLKKLYADRQWRRVVRQFMIHHRAETPYFLEIPQEFIRFLQDEYDTGDDDPPFLLELAHYEWSELALSVSEDADDPARIDADGDMLAGIPVKSVLAWPLSYRYPVHRISDAFQPDKPEDQATFIVVFRNQDDELGFMELNPVTARLLDLIASNDQRKNGRELLTSLAAEIAYPDPNALIEHGSAAMREMRASDILLGTLR